MRKAPVTSALTPWRNPFSWVPEEGEEGHHGWRLEDEDGTVQEEAEELVGVRPLRGKPWKSLMLGGGTPHTKRLLLYSLHQLESGQTQQGSLHSSTLCSVDHNAIRNCPEIFCTWLTNSHCLSSISHHSLTTIIRPFSSPFLLLDSQIAIVFFHSAQPSLSAEKLLFLYEANWSTPKASVYPSNSRNIGHESYTSWRTIYSLLNSQVQKCMANQCQTNFCIIPENRFKKKSLGITFPLILMVLLYLLVIKSWRHQFMRRGSGCNLPGVQSSFLLSYQHPCCFLLQFPYDNLFCPWERTWVQWFWFFALMFVNTQFPQKAAAVILFFHWVAPFVLLIWS